MTLLIHIVIVLLVIGMLLWCVEQVPSIPSPIKTAVKIVVVLFAAIFLLNHAGYIK